MSRSILRALPALLVLSAFACTSPTAPTTTRPRLNAPGANASFDDITPPDSTAVCRTGYMDPQGRTC